MVAPARRSLFGSLHDPGKLSLGRRIGSTCPLVLTLREVDSTNARARDLAARGAPDGSLVIAEAQTRGRGRWSREWISRQGGLYLSAVLRPGPTPVSSSVLSLLPHLTAVAAAEAIEERARVEVEIRWPNDLFYRGAKLGGILCESAFTGSKLDFAVAGIGVNLHQRSEDFGQELREKATSLELAGARDVDRLTLAAGIAERLRWWWHRTLDDPGPCLDRWRELSPGTKGSQVRVQPQDGTPFDARCVGLAEDGALIVALSTGDERRLYAEDVLFLRVGPS